MVAAIVRGRARRDARRLQLERRHQRERQQPQAHQLQQQDDERRAAGLGLGLVPEHGHRRRQLQQGAQRRPGLLDRRRVRAPGVRQVPDRDLGRQGRARRHHARGRPAHRLRDPEGARRPRTVRRERREEELQRRRLEGRLAGFLGLRDPGRRRPDGDDLPQGHLRQVRHHAPDHLGRVRAGRPEGQGRRRPALRRPRQQRAGRDHRADGPEGRRAVHLRPGRPEEHRDQPRRPGDEGRARPTGQGS